MTRCKKHMDGFDTQCSDCIIMIHEARLPNQTFADVLEALYQNGSLIYSDKFIPNKILGRQSIESEVNKP